MRWFAAIIVLTLLTGVSLGDDLRTSTADALQAYVEYTEKLVRESWEANEDWPTDRGEPPELKLTDQQLLFALGSRLHDDVSIDAYIKRQLIDAEPNFTVASLADIGQIVQAMPALLAAPTPGDAKRQSSGESNKPFIFIGRQEAYVSDLIPIPGTNSYKPVMSTYVTGVGLNGSSAAFYNGKPSVMDTIRLENGRLQRRRALVAKANAPAIGYRNVLIDGLPVSGGIQFAARLEDVFIRVSAGDTTYSHATRCLVDAADDIADDRSISASVRGTLKKRLNEVYQVHTVVTHSMNVPDGSNTVTLDQQTIRLDKDSYKYILAALNGRRLRHKPE